MGEGIDFEGIVKDELGEDYLIYKNKIIEELKKEYTLIPIKEAKLNVTDILEKYSQEIADKCSQENNYKFREPTFQAIRKCVCLNFGCTTLKNIPTNKKNEFRQELERFIKEYILGGK